jgi:DNA-directed RNA polymerase specialized sigma24 family protein
MVTHPRAWPWSSYRATAGDTSGPPWLTTEWVLGQFGRRQREAQRHYRQFVAEGRGGPRPWDQVIGQLYLGSEAFIARHQPDRPIREIPRRQTQASRPSLRILFQHKQAPARLIHEAYRRHGYRLAEIADHLGVHYATVSRRLKAAEQPSV